jgi:hypothetical protein
VIPYWLIAVMRYGAASTLVAHSLATGASAHDPEVGAMMRSIEAAEVPACREERGENDVAGMAEADAVALRRKMYNVEKNIMYDYCGIWSEKTIRKIEASRYAAQ